MSKAESYGSVAADQWENIVDRLLIRSRVQPAAIMYRISLHPDGLVLIGTHTASWYGQDQSLWQEQVLSRRGNDDP